MMSTEGNMTLDGRPLADALDDVLREVRALKRGEDTGAQAHLVWVAPDVDVAAVRSALGLTQAEFAARYGFSLPAVRKWETGARRPDAGARTLLWLLSKDHETIDAMLSAA